METDKEKDEVTLKILNARRLLELRRRANLASTKETKPTLQKPPTSREKLLRVLVDRGDEVLYSAESRYPREMKILIPKIANLITEKKISTISGGELLQFLRAMGLRISVSTTISIEDHGKFVSLSDKIRERSEG